MSIASSYLFSGNQFQNLFMNENRSFYLGENAINIYKPIYKLLLGEIIYSTKTILRNNNSTVLRQIYTKPSCSIVRNVFV